MTEPHQRVRPNAHLWRSARLAPLMVDLHFGPFNFNDLLANLPKYAVDCFPRILRPKEALISHHQKGLSAM